ncbi:MAG: iron ABC transporter substrate-binding protein [Aggregatilineales bacterium]
MRQSWKVLFLVFAMLLVAAAPALAQPPAETLVIYSGRSQDLIGPLLQQFSAETGINVEVRYGGTAEMAATILEEGANSPADVYIAQDAGALGALANAGLLRPLSSDVLERVGPEFRSPAGLWVGLSGRARVLVYNTDMVSPDELPDSLLDLTDPVWNGRIGWAPTNGSFQSHVTALRLLLGEDGAREWLEGIIANNPVQYENNRAIVSAVIAGEVEVGLVNHYYLYGFLAQTPDAPAENHFFTGGDPGALINIAGAAVLNTSSRPGLAERLLLYMLGNDAQQYFSDVTFEYPLAAGVVANPALVPLNELEVPALDLSDLADLEGTLNLLREVGALP